MALQIALLPLDSPSCALHGLHLGAGRILERGCRCVLKLSYARSLHNSLYSNQLRLSHQGLLRNLLHSNQLLVSRTGFPLRSLQNRRWLANREMLVLCAVGSATDKNVSDCDEEECAAILDEEGHLRTRSEDHPNFLESSQVSEFEADLTTVRPDVDDPFMKTREAAWFQELFFKVAIPVVRLVSGAYLNQSEPNGRGKAEGSWSFSRMLTGALPPGCTRWQIGEKLRQAESDFFTFSSHLGKYLFIMMATGAILAMGYQLAGGDPQQETVLWYSWLAGIISGSMIGSGKVLEYRFRAGPRNVVITGSTRGLGKALAREFLLAGDRVVIASRSPDSVTDTVKELQEEVDSRSYHPFARESSKVGDLINNRPSVVGMACDVSKVEDVEALAKFAVENLGSIDIWVNNAGVNKGFRPLVQFTDDDIRQIVSANLIGSLLCSRKAIRVMKEQPKGGHVFNMDGAGSGGSSTPLTAVYGSTKCGLRQLHASLLKECKRTRVGIHTASPGMVLTDLLLSGASVQNKKMFNIICELPETVARALVPRMRDVKGTGKAINFLTPPRILLALITAWLRRGRWFDEEGQAVYAAEADRVRNWAEGRTRLPVSAAIDQFSDSTLISVFSISVICAFIMLSSSGSGMPGT